MAFADFLAKRFLGEKIFVSINDGESEVLIFDQHWTTNREYFEGVLVEAEDNGIVLNIENEGNIYINVDNISYVWTNKNINPSKIIRTSLNKAPYIIGKK